VLRTFLFWLGGISMYIYTLHPTTRALFINLSTDINSYRIVIIYTITTLVTAWIAQKVISRIS
jgi:fucose 4-O-acetylase-like acetyltransferase